MNKIFTPLRDRLNKKLIKQADTPIIIYIAVGAGILVALALSRWDADLSQNLVSEIIGAAFTLFVIDVLLVKSKSDRWKVVQKHVDYLIARTVNRLRDGVSTRAFSIHPIVRTDQPEDVILIDIREQREIFLQELDVLTVHELEKRIDKDFFSEDNYDYFNEKADDVWDILNMKYSEYLAPELVSLLMALHTNLKDLCGQIRVYKKAQRFPEEKEYYKSSGIKGAAHNLNQIVSFLIQLKREGYSEAAR